MVTEDINIIKQEQEKYKSLFDNLLCGFALHEMIYDKNGEAIDYRFLELNEAFEKSTGLKRKDIINKKVTEVIPEINKDSFDWIKEYSDVAKFAKEKKFVEYSKQLNKWFKVVAYSPKKGQFATVILDITKEKEKEIAIKESEEKYRKLFNSAFDAITVIEGYKFIEANSILKEKYGFDEEQVLGLHPWDLSPKTQPDGRNSKEKGIELLDLAYSGVPQKFFWNHINSKGDLIHAEIALNKFELSGKNFLLAMWRDDTERIKAEEGMRAGKEKLEQIINSISEVMISIDSEGKINGWNKAAEKITGIEKNMVISRTINSEILSKNLLPIIFVLRNTMEENKPQKYEIKIKDIHNNSFLLRGSTSIFKEDKKLNGAVLIGKDVTSHKDVEKLLLPGNAYLDSENLLEELIQVINEFPERKKLLVTRGNNSFLKSSLNKAKIILMNNKQSENSISDPISLFEEITAFIEENKKSLVIINRLNYFIRMYSSEEVMKLLYNLSDLISENDCILIIQIESDSFNKILEAEIRQEIKPLPNIDQNLILDERKINVLNFIAAKNDSHIKISFNNVGKEFDISKITTRQWLQELQERRLIKVQQLGRVKYLTITDKGRKLLNKSFIARTKTD